jgi:hypothetical protein
MMVGKSGKALRVLRRLIVLGSSMFLLGCQPHEEEHEEHFPPHWPSSFIEAAERLDRIIQTQGPIETKAPSVEQELADLVDWLPELIADSSVSKSDFDRIDGWAFPMAPVLKAMVEKGSKREQMIAQPGLREGVASLLELADREKQRNASDERERAIVPTVGSETEGTPE